MRKLPFILGPLVILFGGWLVLTVLAFATLIDPSLTDDEWWRVYLYNIFGEFGNLLTGVAVIVAGFWIAAGGGRDGRGKPSHNRSS